MCGRKHELTQTTPVNETQVNSNYPSKRTTRRQKLPQQTKNKRGDGHDAATNGSPTLKFLGHLREMRARRASIAMRRALGPPPASVSICASITSNAATPIRRGESPEWLLSKMGEETVTPRVAPDENAYGSVQYL